MEAIQKSLDELRRDIDRIDDALHDLVMRRAEIAGRIAELKLKDDESAYRPGREASVLRRLVERHRGPFPRPVVVSIWRQIISALLGIQGPFSVAVFDDGPEGAYWDFARDHFGFLVPMVRHRSVRQVVRAVTEGAATVGVLPEPQDREPDPWWRGLASTDAKTPRIVARLPFAGVGNGRGEDLTALVIAKTWPEPTGKDHAFLIVETAEEVSRARLKSLLTEVGLAPLRYCVAAIAMDPPAWATLVEVAAHVDADDPRLGDIAGKVGPTVKRVIRAGGYAAPFTKAELETKIEVKA